MGHTLGRGPLGLNSNKAYIDDGTMCCAPSPTPGITGLYPTNTSNLPTWKSQQVLDNALIALKKVSVKIEESGAGYSQDIIDKTVGGVEGVGWFVKSTIEGIVDSVKWVYDYYRSG